MAINILLISDVECPALWDYYQPGRLAGYEEITREDLETLTAEDLKE